MGDVAQILKQTNHHHHQAPSGSGGGGGGGANNHPPKAMKMSGISKEVMTLLGGKQDPMSAALPPIVPSFLKENGPNADENAGVGAGGGKEIKVKVGTKWITSSKPARQWAWAPFASSSRTDGAMFRHWVRANVEYTDYPYAKFDIHLDPVTYTDEEFGTYLKSDSWTKSETDKLMELVRKYELRWAVIHDRWLEHYSSQEEEHGADITTRKVEDLQERYYTVAAILTQIRIRQEAGAEVQAIAAVQQDPSAPGAADKADQLLLESAAARALATAAPNAQPLVTNLGTGSTNKVFDVTQERERRAQLDRLWRRSKEEETEEMELRKELREIETQLRKLKKSGGHILAAAGGGAAAGSRAPNAASSRNASRSVTPVPGAAIVDNPELLNQSFASTAPVPMPQTPYLQSGRLAPPAAGGSVGINKSMLTRMQQVLTELKIPTRPLPTKRVCDIYDSVRKDILTLVTLQKMVMQKEGTLHAKRVKLSKLGGSDVRVLDEEDLLGIVPPPPPPPAQAAAPAPAKKSSKPGTGNSKAKSSSGAAKSKPAAKPKPVEDASKASDGKETKDAPAKKAKSSSGTKRKRKPDATAKDGKEPVKKAATTTPSSATGTATATTLTTTAKAPAKAPPAATKTAPAATSTGSTSTPAKTTAAAKITKTPAKAPAATDAAATIVSTSASSGKKRVRKPQPET